MKRERKEENFGKEKSGNRPHMIKNADISVTANTKLSFLAILELYGRKKLSVKKTIERRP
jgi:hypothetical protein